MGAVMDPRTLCFALHHPTFRHCVGTNLHDKRKAGVDAAQSECKCNTVKPISPVHVSSLTKTECVCILGVLRVQPAGPMPGGATRTDPARGAASCWRSCQAGGCPAGAPRTLPRHGPACLTMDGTDASWVRQLSCIPLHLPNDAEGATVSCNNLGVPSTFYLREAAPAPATRCWSCWRSPTLCTALQPAASVRPGGGTSAPAPPKPKELSIIRAITPTPVSPLVD
eukprot:gene9622-biopygen19745